MPVLRSIGARALLLFCAFFGGTIGLPARVDAVGTTVGMIRRVPAQYPTIQGAVDAAAPGDLILIDGGTYRETVVAVSYTHLTLPTKRIV